MFTYNLFYIYLVLFVCTTVYGIYQYTYDCIMISKYLKENHVISENKIRVDPQEVPL